MNLTKAIPLLESTILEYFTTSKIKKKEKNKEESKIESLVNKESITQNPKLSDEELFFVAQPEMNYALSKTQASEEHQEEYNLVTETNEYAIYQDDEAEINHDESNPTDQEVIDAVLTKKANATMKGSAQIVDFEQERKLENYKLIHENRVWLKVLYDLSFA